MPTPQFHEFPKWLKHGETDERTLVHDHVEERKAAKRGFIVPDVQEDREAFVRAHAVPYNPKATKDEWPKWINGRLVDERPKDMSYIYYPKMLKAPDGSLHTVPTAEAEAEMLALWTDPEPPKAVEAA